MQLADPHGLPRHLAASALARLKKTCIAKHATRRDNLEVRADIAFVSVPGTSVQKQAV